MGKSVWDYVAPVLGGIAGTLIAPGIGTAIGAGIGSGTTTGVETGSPVAGLLSGVAGGAGSAVGGSLLGPVLGSIGGGVAPITGGATSGLLGQSIGASLGDTALSGLGSALGNATGGSLIGGAIGSGVAQGATEAAIPGPFNPKPNTVDWHAQQQSAMGLPSSLSNYAGLNPDQQASNIATGGIYGGGVGPEESNYFLNLINRKLTNGNGGVANDTSGLAPIDMSFLSQLGINNAGPNQILQGIQKYGS